MFVQEVKETEQQVVNLILAKQIFIIGKIILSQYFLAV